MKKLFLLGFIFLVSLSFVQAANCGGEIQCNCGDTVVEDTILNHDILNCGGTNRALLIDTDYITLDCNGHIISGLDLPDTYGIQMDYGEGVTIKNCIVKDFMHSMLIRYSSNNFIYNNTVQGSTSGISLAYESNGNTLWKNNFSSNSYNAQELNSYNNNWNNSQLGNYWDNFESNNGFPNYYEIGGNGGGIDWHPNQFPPVLTPLENIEINEGETLTIQLNATDPNEWDNLTYYINADLPPGYEFNQENGLFTWETTHQDAGLYYIEFSVTDGYRWDYENITIIVIDVPISIDLDITNEDILFSDDYPLKGTPVTITAFFRNLGTEDPDEVLIRFYKGEPSNETYIGEDLVQIRDRSTFFAQTEWIPEFDGDYNIHVWVDPEDGIVEENENNNIASKVLYVTTIPELRIRNEDIGFSDNNPTSGDDIQIFAMIRNLENEPANNFTVRFYDNTGYYNSLIGEVEISIGGQQTEVAIIDWTASPHGPHNIQVVVDYYNIIEEWDETNNQASKTINVLHPHPENPPDIIILGEDNPL